MTARPYVCSASQVRTAEDCLRKWGFDKLDRVPRIPHASAALGSAVHAQLEAYLRDGVPLDLLTLPGRIAMAGVHLLPKPPFLVEHPLDFSLDGVPFVGFVDVLSPGVVHDHKTTGDLRWCLTTDELQGDTQGTLYAHATRSDELHWIYYRTREPHRALDVRAKVDKMRSDDRLAATARTARTLRTIAEDPPPLGAIELPPNPDACDRYGGCPHKGVRCQGDFTDQERLRAFMSTASLLDSLEQRINPPAVPPPAAAPAAPVSDEPPLLTNGTRDLPPGLFWYRGATGWAAAPDKMRAHLDPDGTKSWPRPYDVAPGVAFTTLAGIQVLATQAEAEQALGAAPGALDGLLHEGPATVVMARPEAPPTNPLASVLASANAADPTTSPHALTTGNAAAAELEAIMTAAPPAEPKAKRGRPRRTAAADASESPDLDPRVKVLHDPDASGPEQAAMRSHDEAIEEAEAALTEPAPAPSCADRRAVVDRLRDTIIARALNLVRNASAAELVDLMAIVGGFDS